MRILCVIFCLFSGSAFAQSKAEMIQKLNERYTDFFERREREERRDASRLSGRDEVRDARQMEEELREKARKRFVLNRKPPADLTASYQAYLKAQEKERKAYLETQKTYSKIQSDLERILKQGKQIPPVLEYSLQDAL